MRITQTAALFATALVLWGCSEAEPETPNPLDDPFFSQSQKSGNGGVTQSTFFKPSLGDGRLKPVIEAAQKEAKENGQDLYIETTADFCKPCKAINRYVNDPSMVEAFAGTYILQIDVTEWERDELAQHGILTSSIPIFYAIGKDGRATGRKLSSAAWGEDIPANMAPVLKRFFQRE